VGYPVVDRLRLAGLERALERALRLPTVVGVDQVDHGPPLDLRRRVAKQTLYRRAHVPEQAVGSADGDDVR